MKLSRRNFLKLGLVTSGGLALGVAFTRGKGRIEKMPNVDGDFRPNVWIQVNRDNSIVLSIPEAEMGQGVRTSLAMLMAEELEVEWQAIRLVQAEPGKGFGKLNTSGSTSIRENWEVLRQAGAVAREMLVAAAARHWQVDPRECTASNGEVIHAPSRQRLSYGELATKAAQQPLPADVALKKPEEWKLIGQPLAMIDSLAMVTGKAGFGIDFQIDGMVFATVVHSPVFGGRPTHVDERRARRVAGFQRTVMLSEGVAVVASDTWSAMQAAKVLEIQWSESPFADENDDSIRQKYLSALKRPVETAPESGDVDPPRPVRTVSAIYELPYQAHMTMEPMNCTVHLHDGICEIWVPTQSPTSAYSIAKWLAIGRLGRAWNQLREKLGLEGDSRLIKIHPQLIGGGFGRRLKQDYVTEAIEIAKAIDLPVKLTWSREEDLQHDYYRPCTAHELSAGLGEDGRPLSWSHHIAGGDKMRSRGGALDNLYGIPSFSVTYTDEKNAVPIGSWRSVGYSHNIFVIESFIDELAVAADSDPLAYRLKLLDQQPRCRKVLEKVAGMCDWTARKRAGRHLGVAVMKGYDSYVAQVVEVREQAAGFGIVKVYCAVDCGTVVNRDSVEAQIEGGIVFALTSVLKSRVKIARGRVVQSNFHDMPMLTMKETPPIEIEIIPGDAAPGGIGELSVPCLAPALANALFSLTGERQRSLWI